MLLQRSVSPIRYITSVSSHVWVPAARWIPMRARLGAREALGAYLGGLGYRSYGSQSSALCLAYHLFSWRKRSAGVSWVKMKFKREEWGHFALVSFPVSSPKFGPCFFTKLLSHRVGPAYPSSRPSSHFLQFSSELGFHRSPWAQWCSLGNHCQPSSSFSFHRGLLFPWTRLFSWVWLGPSPRALMEGPVA